MTKSQTVIAIKRDSVPELRLLNHANPRFLRRFLEFNSKSNYPKYLSNSIFVSHSEHESINSCHLITPFLGITLTNIFHKSFSNKQCELNSDILFYDKKRIVDNLIMGYKGIFEVNKIDELEINSDFANSKNSTYCVFGIQDIGIKLISKKDFDIMLDAVDFKNAEKYKDIEKMCNFKKNIKLIGSFSQRQVCLAFQSNGIFKAYAFKANKSIHFDVDKIIADFKQEAIRLNHRFAFADEETKEKLILTYVSTYEFREVLSNRFFEAFITGIRGEAIRV